MNRGELHVLDAGLPRAARGVFTTIRGGVSGDGHGRTNLSLRSDDEPRRTLANRDLLAAEVALASGRLAFAAQVHGSAVATVDLPLSREQLTAGVPGVDALVTTRANIGLVVLAADCMPVLLVDDEVGVAAAAHCGRQGLVAGVLTRTVEVMTARGADPARIVAAVGPCIGPCCYELPAALVATVDRLVPGVAASTSWQMPSIDLRAGADAVLAAAGVGQVRHLGGCTFEQPDLFYSYRRDGGADRHGGVVVLR